MTLWPTVRPPIVLGALLFGTASAGAAAATFEATAYSLEGEETASGATARPGIVAADPRVIPLGSRIRVDGAGEHSGEYTVEDTGRTITGREIDILVPDAQAATRFGRKQVQVEILERGTGDRDP